MAKEPLNLVGDLNSESKESDSSRFENHLANSLSRIAAIQGFAVPAHRFLMSTMNIHGASIQKLSPELQAREIWLTFFSNGEAYEISQAKSKEDLPALWLSSLGSNTRILKGMLSDGSFISEDEAGNEITIVSGDIINGKTLVLRPKLDLKHAKKTPKSAREWFFYAIKKRKAPFLEAILASLVISVLTLGISFYTMQVYDRVISTQSYSTLIVITVGVLIAVFLEFLTKEIRGRILDKACKFIDIELSGVFFGKMLSIRMDARPKTVGTFAAQIKQFEMVRNFMTASTLFVLADLPFVIFFIAVIWAIGGAIALVPLILLPLSILAGFYATWKIGVLAEDQLIESNQKNGLLIEAIDGIEAIKAVGGEWKMLEFWKHLTLSTSDKELTIRTITNMSSSITQTVQQLSYILLIAVGVYEITNGHITMGALMACSIISNRALSPIAQISGKIVQWQHAKVALKGLDSIMKLPTDRNENTQMIIPEVCEGRIRAAGLSFAYYEESLAINNVNLNIKPGERIAIIGPVGSGKSTLIKTISGLYRPTKGQVFLDEVDMAHIDPEFLRESIGYLTQDVRLFNGTLRYNLTIGLPSPRDAQILDACKKTGLIEIIKNHDKGLELPIYEGGKGLSGGQRQLVGLTRVLIAKPKIILLDEPTASMDGDLELKIMKSLFEESRKDAVIVLSTHKLGLLNFVDRIIVLDKSKVVFDGPKDQVLAKLMKKPVKAEAANQEVNSA
jgi:ATP-binding cassette subfamily C protein LapB